MWRVGLAASHTYLTPSAVRHMCKIVPCDLGPGGNINFGKFSGALIFHRFTISIHAGIAGHEERFLITTRSTEKFVIISGSLLIHGWIVCISG